MSDTVRTFAGRIHKEISRDPDIVSRRVRDAKAECDLALAVTRSKEIGEVESFTRMHSQHGKLVLLTVFVNVATNELTSFTLIAKRRHLAEMQKAVKDFGERIAQMAGGPIVG